MAPPSATGVEVYGDTDTSGVTLPNPLNLHGIPKRRAAAGKLIAGIAAVSNIESFKGEAQHLHKHKARRWDRAWPDPHRRNVILIENQTISILKHTHARATLSKVLPST